MGENGTKRDQLVHSIRQLIMNGEFAPGDRLTQEEVATQFSTSITPVREALRQLAAEGILFSEPHRGVRVAELDLNAVKGNYVIRRLVEPYVMQRATRRIAPRDVERAASINYQMAEAVRRDEQRTVWELNHQFHQLFFDRCGIQSLTKAMQSFWPAFPMFQALPGRAIASITEHEAILDAVRTGGLDAVYHATEVHLTHSYQALARFITGAEVPDPFDLDCD